ncbi:MAG: hypothetical protein LUE99_03585 [Bacteroides sp.]|nr:hypothetical protein [Bacteroides sp.]
MTIITGTLDWYHNNEGDAAYQYLYNDSKTLYDPCPAGWKIPFRTIYSQWNVNQAYWFNSNGDFVVTGGSHDRGGRLYNISGANGLPDFVSIHNTAWFPVTAFRGSGDGNLAQSGNPAGYIGTNTLAKASAGYRIYYVKLDKSQMGTSSNTYGYINEPYPFPVCAGIVYLQVFRSLTYWNNGKQFVSLCKVT